MQVETINGREDFSRFNLSEHAGLCKGGSPLIGASIVACYATASLRASCDAEGRQGSPANWEIDEQQETLIEQWAKAANLWEDDFSMAIDFLPEGLPKLFGKPCNKCWKAS